MEKYEEELDAEVLVGYGADAAAAGRWYGVVSAWKKRAWLFMFAVEVSVMRCTKSSPKG